MASGTRDFPVGPELRPRDSRAADPTTPRAGNHHHGRAFAGASGEEVHPAGFQGGAAGLGQEKMKSTLKMVLGSAWLGLAGSTHGANNPASAALQPDLSGSLRETVAGLAEKEKRPAGDYARMAEETISFGSNPEALNQLKSKIPDEADPHGSWRNMVQDALAGVDEGERLDPKAANWPELRERLKQLQPPPPPPSQGGSNKDKKNQKEDQKKDKNDLS